MNTRYIRTIAILIGSLGLAACSSWAARPYACREENIQSFPAGGMVLIGNVFQIGDCALSKHFFIELDGYYSRNKMDIDYAVSNFEKIKLGAPEKITILSQYYNCKDGSDRIFFEKLAQNKTFVFGENFSNSSSNVNKNIQKMIDSDQELQKDCD